MELYCVTCSAWCGDDLTERSGHLASARHTGYEKYYERQRVLRAMQAPAQGGGAGAQQCAFVGGPPNPQQRMHEEEEQKDYVTHEELEMRCEQIRSCG
eukprot:11155374-Heterocapsa_arctica.AAC.1